MILSQRIIANLLLLGVLPFFLPGCSKSEPEEIVVPQTYGNMKTLAGAYIQYTDEKKRPPEKLDDLRPYIHPDIDLQKLAKSENDGENYVIVWGVNYHSARNPQGVMPIMIYELLGKGGIRYVCQFNDVQMFNVEQMKSAYFPAGHTPSL